MAEQTRENFDVSLTRLAEVAKALSHPARIRILQILWEFDDCVCNEIVESLPLAQPTVSQHLKELKRVGLIRATRSSPKTYYCLNKEVVAEVMTSWSQLLASIGQAGGKRNAG
jgi:DNA-binding transcriptional ArsR family regulator